MARQCSSSAFTQAVVRTMRKLYPEELADKSFDNTGLLLEAPQIKSSPAENKVLLAIDLTRAVAEEAIEQKASIIVAYHPIIFRGLKALGLANSQQTSLLRLAQAGISVYCPHTAIDAAPGGLSDWLADIVTRERATQISELSRRLASGSPHSRRAIQPVSTAIPGFEGAGAGRVVTFETPVPLREIIRRVGSGLEIDQFPVAAPQGKNIDDIQIKTVGLCAGSGGSMLAGLDVDLLFTGELSHHEALAAIEQGKVVIAPFHSNTERRFLHTVLRLKLLLALRAEWEATQAGDLDAAELDSDCDVVASKHDREVYEIVNIHA